MEQLQDKIQEWIDSPERDHFEGIGLLSQLIGNRMLIRTLSRKETSYSREKLRHELSKQLKYLPSVNTSADTTDVTFDSEGFIEPSTPATGMICPPADLVTGEFPPLPPAEQNISLENVVVDPVHKDSAEQLEIAWGKMYNKKGILINSMRDFPESDAEGRKKVMDQIKGLDSDMDSIRGKVDHFNLHGFLPPSLPPAPPETPNIDPVIPDDPILMHKLLMNERSTISKLRSKIKSGADPDELKNLEERLAKKTDLVNEIQRRLSGANGS